MMRDALLRDLVEINDQVHTTVDARVCAPKKRVQCVVITPEMEAWQIWQQKMSEVDAVWLIAPETGGVLQRLTQLGVDAGKLVLGCAPESIGITTSKYATWQALVQAGVRTIPTYRADDFPRQLHDEWLVKPDDGAGCEETRHFDDAQTLSTWLASQANTGAFVIQPYQTGIPASMSCLIQHGKALVLSCNRQHIIETQGVLAYQGSVLNELQAHWQAFEQVANQVAAAISGLAGYVGIDVIVHEEEIFVVEVNPRLTTSYVGLRQATGHNPAALVIRSFLSGLESLPVLQRNVVHVQVAPHD